MLARYPAAPVRSRLVITLLAVAFAAGGCGSQPSSAEEFEGDERAVAETVEDLQRAAERQEADRACRDFLSEELAGRIAAAGENCQEELEKAIADADVVELEVEDVQVDGTTATARVRGEGEPEDAVRTLEFVKAGDPERWRVDSFAASG